jgi:hypothetical protein
MVHLKRLSLICLALFALGGMANAHEVTMRAEERIVPYDGIIPACDSSEVLKTIEERFSKRERSYWDSTLSITGIDRIDTIGYRPWGADFIPRRFCTARAELNNGKHHTLTYSIVEDGAIIGYTWDVQWCVTGLDRNMYFAPQCRAARP